MMKMGMNNKWYSFYFPGFTAPVGPWRNMGLGYYYYYCHQDEWILIAVVALIEITITIASPLRLAVPILLLSTK